MDLDLPVIHHRASQETLKIVTHVRPDQWHDPTPCTEWDVHDLLNHIVAENRWVKPLVDGETIADVGDRLDGDQLGESPLMAYEASAAEADLAFCGDGAMDKPVAVSYGPVPAAVFCGHRIIDVVIHGWDLAKAIGQDTRIEPELVEACWAIVEPERDLLTGSGMFGQPVAVPDDADRQTKLLAALGREA